MKILSVKKNELDTAFEVELDQKEWEKAFDAQKKNLAKNIQIEGFRKGHVPASIIDERITPDQVAYETLNRQQKYIQDIIESKEFKDSDCIDSVSGLEIVKLNGRNAPTVKVHFDLVPTISGFKMEDVKAIEIPPFKKQEVPEAFIKGQIAALIKNDCMVADKDGAVANGDIAVINFKGFVDGKEFKGGSAKEFELEIGSKSFIDNFEDQLIGCKKGDKKDVNVHFPKEYHVKDLAGKPAKFEVEVLGVKSVERPEINKEYLKSKHIDAANEKELEAYIKKVMNQQAEVQYQDMVMRIINNAISTKVKLNYYPASLLDMHKRQILNQYQEEAKRSGFESLAKYKKRLGLKEEDFNKVLNESAKSCLGVALAYEKLIDEYKLKVEEADKKDYLSKLARYLGGEDKANEVWKNNKDYCESTILRDKLFKKLIAEAKKIEPKAKEAKPAKKAK